MILNNNNNNVHSGRMLQLRKGTVASQIGGRSLHSRLETTRESNALAVGSGDV